MAAKHFITKASMNASEGLSGAIRLWSETRDGPSDMRGALELIEIINRASISLARICRMADFQRELDRVNRSK